MAQTKTKTKPKPKGSSGSSRSRSSRSRSGNGAKSGGAGAVREAVESAGKKVENAGKDVGQATGQVASKAKLPLVAGGAALVGVASGIAIGANRSGGKVLGIRLPKSKRVSITSSDLAKAAKEVGSFGEQVGGLTSELKRMREGLADGQQGSPLEVLLRGLTTRRPT